MERIICAAIWYDDNKYYNFQPKNIKHGYVWCGRRHHNVINLRGDLLGLQTKNDVQGFVTSEDRFVDREEAFQIAKLAGQLPDYLVSIRECNKQKEPELFSEDLY
jgi:hypothetical protein